MKKKTVHVYRDELLFSWTEHYKISKYCKEVLRIYFFCAGFMQRTAKRRKQLLKYYKYAPLIAEKIEASPFKKFFYQVMSFSIVYGTVYISGCEFKKAHKEFKSLFKKFMAEFKLK